MKARKIDAVCQKMHGFKDANTFSDANGKTRREKKRGSTRWGKYDDEEFKADELENISVTKRKAVRPRKRKKITACAPPEEGKTRFTGIVVGYKHFGTSLKMVLKETGAEKKHEKSHKKQSATTFSNRSDT
jgi:hypothetical protein